MKRKTITLVVYMLVCISLVSVGFAAWVITGGESTEATGNVSASVVHDESVYIEKIGWDSDTQTSTGGTIKFGAPADASSGWLQGDSADGEEDLFAIYYFKVKLGDNADPNSYLNGETGAINKLGECSLTLTEGASIKELRTTHQLIGASSIKFYVADSEQSVKAATSYSDYSSSAFKAAFVNYATDSKELYVAVKIEYSWGDYFGGDNPYDFYAGKEETSENKNDAIQKLELLNSKLLITAEDVNGLAANEIILNISFKSKSSN